MSEPVKSVEIDDVLSSIRRLVSVGDKARALESAIAKDSAGLDSKPIIQPPESSGAGSRTDRLVLTPAFLVSNSMPKRNEGPLQDVNSFDADAADDGDNNADVADVDCEPFHLTDMIWESVDKAKAEGRAAINSAKGKTSGQSDLVATIAELEAAISFDADDYEPDGGEAMADTIAWPGEVRRQFQNVEDPDAAEVESDVSQPQPRLQESRDGDKQVKHDAVSAVHKTTQAQKPIVATPPRDFASDGDVYEDDDLDGLFHSNAAPLDEAALRMLVSEVVREELTGPLGERITRNVRKLVRREIYRVLSTQEFD